MIGSGIGYRSAIGDDMLANAGDVWALCATVVSDLPNLKGVLIEHDSSLPDLPVLLRQADRARNLFFGVERSSGRRDLLVR